jgi:muramoyltetrapeptide carboxypeptidase
LSAGLDERLQELLWAFEDPTINGIFTVTGGFGSAELLPYIPFDRISRTPKVFMGFSDTTALNSGFLLRSGLLTYNGPSVSVRIDNKKNKDSDGLALKDALKFLMDDETWGSRVFFRNGGFPRCVFPGEVKGKAIGGNLTTFAGLLGTPFLPSLEGAILFLEDVDEGGYELLRTLTHLSIAGVFSRVAGVVLGEFARFPEKVDPGDPSVEDVVVEFFKRGPPCVYGLNFSHGSTGAIIPIGATTHLDADRAEVFFEYCCHN